MSKKTAIDLDAVRTFYDPHPGFAGAAIPIPKEVKKVADDLNGKKLSVREALEKLRAATNGELRVVTMDINFIILRIKTHDGATHGFRVICFK